MKSLYAARLARGDLLEAVNHLARHFSNWSTNDDKAFYRIMCYINCTFHLRQVGYVGDVPGDLAPHVYADADLAGCSDTQRSTTGVYAALEGPHLSLIHI